MSVLNFLRKAYFEAKYSPDPSTQNGAIIVARNDIIASGYNTFPNGVKFYDERWERPGKYQYVEHAERNAIFDAARQGHSTEGAIMYCPWFACTDCARAIIQSGISVVIGHAAPIHDKGSDAWKESIKVAYQMFDEA